jgi:hypothetical protein
MKEIGSIEGLEGLFGSKEEIEDKTKIENGSKHATEVEKLIGHLDGFFFTKKPQNRWRNDPLFSNFRKIKE